MTNRYIVEIGTEGYYVRCLRTNGRSAPMGKLVAYKVCAAAHSGAVRWPSVLFYDLIA